MLHRTLLRGRDSSAARSAACAAATFGTTRSLAPAALSISAASARARRRADEVAR
jgi:hypothetical protein